MYEELREIFQIIFLPETERLERNIQIGQGKREFLKMRKKTRGKKHFFTPFLSLEVRNHEDSKNYYVKNYNWPLRFYAIIIAVYRSD